MTLTLVMRNVNSLFEETQIVEFLTIDQVKKKVSLCRASVYKFVETEGFPAPAKVGTAVRWDSDEVEQWMKARLDARAAA